MSRTSVDVMAELLDEAKRICCGDRNKDYGDPVENHAREAAFYNVYLQQIGPRALDGYDACVLHKLSKIARSTHYRKRGGLVDIAGYAANAQACQEGGVPRKPIPPDIVIVREGSTKPEPPRVYDYDTGQYAPDPINRDPYNGT